MKRIIALGGIVGGWDLACLAAVVALLASPVYGDAFRPHLQMMSISAPAAL